MASLPDRCQGVALRVCWATHVEFGSRVGDSEEAIVHGTHNANAAFVYVQDNVVYTSWT